jgi:hypothetical protein
MYELFFGDNAAWYTIPALIGTAFFTLRMVLLLLGSGHHLGFDTHDVGHAGHMGDAHADADQGDSTHSFEILSIQSVAAFVMGFGWAGLAGLKGTHWSPGMVSLVAVGCGVGMVWLLAMLLRGMAEVHSDGTVLITGAVGREGDVYLTVPDRARGGQVRVTIDGRQRIYNAVTQGEDLPTGTRVRVLSANDDNTLTVARA